MDRDSGEFQENLAHREEAEKFYRAGPSAGTVRVGMEASGHARWFERLLAELQIELRIGDAAEIRAKRVRRQKTDRQDARLILQLLLEDRFPQIWVPRGETRELRQLLWHRHRMVQARTRIMEPVASDQSARRSVAWGLWWSSASANVLQRHRLNWVLNAKRGNSLRIARCLSCGIRSRPTPRTSTAMPE